MKKEITIDGQKIEYTIKKYKRNKNLRLAINSRGNLVASKPWYLSEKAIEKFIKEKFNWIKEKIEYFNKLNGRNNYRSSNNEYLSYKKAAERLVIRKITELNSFYQFRFSKISIRNQRTRWGSCSSRGNLNFNYKIIFLPEKMIDYIIIHELCHLKELNHSPKFWRLVAQKIPNHREIRKDLQKKGIELR